MKNSVVVNRLIPVVDKMIDYINSTVADDGLVGVSETERKALRCAQWLMAASEKKQPVELKLVEGDFTSTLSYSRGVRVIGKENLGTLEFSKYVDFECSNVVNRNFFTHFGTDHSYNEVVYSAFAKFMGRFYREGCVDQNGRMWNFAVQSAKQSQEGRAILIADGEYAKPMYDMGFTEAQFCGLPLKKWFKVKMNFFSGQLMFADEVYDACPIEMNECRAFQSCTHKFHTRRVIKYDEKGNKEFKGWDVVTTKPTDSVMIVSIEMLSVKMMAEAEKCAWTEAADKIAAMSYEQMLEYINGRGLLAAQIRGAAIKCMGAGTLAFKMIKEIARAEKCENPVLHFNGEDVPATIHDLAERHIVAWMSEEALKWGNGHASYFRDFFSENGGFLEACAFCKGKNDLKESVTLSRQIVTTLLGTPKEEIVRMFARTRESILATEKPNEIAVSLGIEDTAFVNAMIEEDRNNAIRRAMFSKLEMDGTFSFAITELRPHVAHVLGFDPRKHMTIRGSRCYFGARADRRIVVLHRYPNLKFNMLALLIVNDRDADCYCSGIIVLGWDTLFNVSLKGDYDGDTPLCLFLTKEEVEFMLENFDFDAIFLPDEGEDVTIEEFIEVMLEELTVSPASFSRVCEENGVHDANLFHAYFTLYRAY